MSALDYQQGQQRGELYGRLHARGVKRDADAAIGEWEAYARRLESQLAEARLQSVRNKCVSEANNSAVKQLRRKLQEVAPHEPMAQPGAGTRLIDEAFRHAVESKGYRVLSVERMEIGK